MRHNYLYVRLYDIITIEMKLTLDLPVTTSDRELTEILNTLNHLGIPHNLKTNEWYNRRIILDLDHTFCGFVAGLKIGQMITRKRK